MSWNSSGADDYVRLVEARRILDIIDGQPLSQKDQDFVASLRDKIEEYGEQTRVTLRMIFWLRDIKDKLL